MYGNVTVEYPDDLQVLSPLRREMLVPEERLHAGNPRALHTRCTVARVPLHEARGVDLCLVEKVDEHTELQMLLAQGS